MQTDTVPERLIRGPGQSCWLVIILMVQMSKPEIPKQVFFIVYVVLAAGHICGETVGFVPQVSSYLCDTGSWRWPFQIIVLNMKTLV